MYRRNNKRIISLITVVVFMLGTLISSTTAVFADYNDNYSFVTPEDILGSIPKYSGDPFKLPNPLNGTLPNSPSTGGQEQPPQAPGEINFPNLPDLNNNFTHNVAPATGALRLQETDVSLPGNSMGFKLERSYSSLVEDAGAFGIGWNHNLTSYLQMYSEFAISEISADGSVLVYNFVQDDSNAFVMSFDGDNLINYNLDKGHYQPAENGNTLVRVSADEYAVTRPDGSKATYKGYITPWRTNQPKTAGQVVKQVDRYGNEQRFAYNADGTISKIIDTAAHVIDFEWTNGLVTKVSTAEGYQLQYQYDAKKHLKKVILPDGGVVEYGYDASDRLSLITDPVGGSTSYAYNSDGKVWDVTNALGVKVYEFSYQSNQTTVKDALSNSNVFKYNDKKLITEEIDALGNSTKYEYSDKDFCTKITSLEGVITREYDDKGHITKEIGLDGAIHSYEYHPIWGLPTKEVFADNSSISYEYDNIGNLIKKIDQLGNDMTFTYDIKGNLLTMSLDNKTTSFEYDNQGNLTKKTTAEGDSTAYFYDGLGRPVKTIEANGATAEMKYNKSGRLVEFKDGLGYITSYSYDEANRIKSIENPAGFVLDYQYNTAGYLTAYKNELGKSTMVQYDAMGRTKKVTDGAGLATEFERDKLDRMIKVKLPEGGEVVYEQGIFGPAKITSPAGTFIYTYNSKKQITSVTDVLGRKTQLQYDIMGRTTAQIDSLGRKTQMEYDQAGHLTKEILQSGNTYKYEYNASGRVVKVTHPDGVILSAIYNKDNSLISQPDRSVKAQYLNTTLAVL